MSQDSSTLLLDELIMKKGAGYGKAKLVNEGTILSDLFKRQWIVGNKLGEGGFGAIYTARESSSNEFNYVIKIEPASNGPLFTEINFYKRVCGEKDVSSWISGKKLKFLGIPRYIGDGLQEADDHRFLIMDRCGNDLHKLLMEQNLSHKCLFQIAINILDVLEYMHYKEYSHADIKALNVLKGYKSPKKVFLLDFGMVTKFMNNGEHKPEKVDNKIKHNGTLEFCPRDSHRGLVSCRRSDIESLTFNLIFWLTWDKNNKDVSERVGFGKLPWLKYIKNLGNKSPSLAILKQVAESKEKYMGDPNLFMESVELDVYPWSQYLLDVVTSVSKLKYTESPKYDDIRKSFAAIICEIDGRTVPSTIDLNKFRDVDWESKNVGAIVKRRKSHIATQMTPPLAPVPDPAPASRKRESDDINQLAPDKPVKKQKTGKKVLMDNNSCAADKKVAEKKTKAKATTKKNVKVNDESEFLGDCFVESSSSVTTKVSEVGSIIPKAAFTKLMKNYIEKEETSKENVNSDKQVKKAKRGETSKENFNVNEEIEKVNKSRKRVQPDPTQSSSTTAARPVEQANNIIPGIKTLDQLKKNGPTRSSPRLAAKHSSRPKSPSDTSKSVSCQTSPLVYNHYRE